MQSSYSVALAKHREQLFFAPIFQKDCKEISQRQLQSWPSTAEADNDTGLLLRLVAELQSVGNPGPFTVMCR